MKQLKIAICGRIRSGKDTVADYLCDNHGFRKFRFGDGIREVGKILYPEEFAKGKPRAIMQGVGQALRQYDPDVWVNYLFNSVKRSGADRVVISDMRQPNELARVKAEGFFVIKVVASEETRIERGIKKGDIFKPEDFYHETESHVDNFDVDLTIHNEGTLEELLRAAEGAYRLANYAVKNGLLDWVRENRGVCNE